MTRSPQTPDPTNGAAARHSVGRLVRPRAKSKRQKRDAWIRRYTGYFGEPLELAEYRAGEVTFDEMYRRAISRAEDMVTEASYIEYGACDE